MNAAIERIEAEILQLSTEERAYLAHRLIESLDDEESDDPAEVERAWEEEIRRRQEEYRSGKVETIPAEEVFREARAWLQCGRSDSFQRPDGSTIARSTAIATSRTNSRRNS